MDEDIYNFDETGFQMGVISTAKVITGAFMHFVFVTESSGVC